MQSSSPAFCRAYDFHWPFFSPYCWQYCHIAILPYARLACPSISASNFPDNFANVFADIFANIFTSIFADMCVTFSPTITHISATYHNTIATAFVGIVFHFCHLVHILPWVECTAPSLRCRAGPTSPAVPPNPEPQGFDGGPGNKPLPWRNEGLADGFCHLLPSFAMFCQKQRLRSLIAVILCSLLAVGSLPLLSLLIRASLESELISVSESVSHT